MAYLVDSDWLIDYLADAPVARSFLEGLTDSGIAISVITYMEAYEGMRRGGVPDSARLRFDALADAIPVIPVSVEVARRCALLREALRSERKRVNARALDLLIAATALEHGLALVTRNTGDYDDIVGLELNAGPAS